MVRVFALVVLACSSMAVAQMPPASPATPPAPVASEPAPSVAVAPALPVEPPVAAEVALEEPKMKKVCYTEDVVGSAFPRRICRMKPVRPSDKPTN